MKGIDSGCKYRQVVIKVLKLLTFLVIKIWKLHFNYIKGRDDDADYKRHQEKSLICQCTNVIAANRLSFDPLNDLKLL